MARITPDKKEITKTHEELEKEMEEFLKQGGAIKSYDNLNQQTKTWNPADGKDTSGDNENY